MREPTLTQNALLAATVLALPAACAEQPPSAQAPGEKRPEPTRLVRISTELLADAEAITPGSTFTLAAVCRVEPGWHTYWPGVNDTGAPATLTLTLPDGWTASDPEWPAPTRHVSPGDLLDHVLEGDFTLLYEVHVPKSAPTDTAHKLTLAADWLVCKNVCVMESSTAARTVRVDNRPTPSTVGAKLVADARAKVPTAQAPDGFTATTDNGVLKIHWAGASHLAFYPASSVKSAVIEYPELLKQGESQGESLSINFHAGNTPAPRIEGVAAATIEDGTAALVRVTEVSLPLNVPAPEPITPKSVPSTGK